MGVVDFIQHGYPTNSALVIGVRLDHYPFAKIQKFAKFL